MRARFATRPARYVADGEAGGERTSGDASTGAFDLRDFLGSGSAAPLDSTESLRERGRPSDNDKMGKALAVKGEEPEMDEDFAAGEEVVGEGSGDDEADDSMRPFVLTGKGSVVDRRS